MMYIHYCKQCNRIFMLNGHRLICPRCIEPLAELRMPYMEFVDMNQAERDKLLEACADEAQLKKLKTTYRMYRYSKWYKELQANNPDNLPITELLANQMRQQKAEKELAAKQAKPKKRYSTAKKMMYYDDLEYIEKMYGDDIISTEKMPVNDETSQDQMSGNDDNSGEILNQKNLKADEINHSKGKNNKKKPDFDNMN